MPKTYTIRNDLTGRTWTANKSEAKYYAIGGSLDAYHSVFEDGGSGIPLTLYDL